VLSRERLLDLPVFPNRIFVASLPADVPACSSAGVLPGFMSPFELAPPPGLELPFERRKGWSTELQQLTTSAAIKEQSAATMRAFHLGERKGPSATPMVQVCECSEELPEVLALLKALRIKTPQRFGGIFQGDHTLCASCNEFILDYLSKQKSERSLATSLPKRLSTSAVEHRTTP
jgi:hypothetical protein